VEFGWGEAWGWGLSLIAVTITLHAFGVVMAAVVLVRVRGRIADRGWAFWHAALFAVAAIGAVGFVLALLHGIEAGIWAAMYVWLGALDSGRDAILYSVDSMTTRGAAGIRLENSWQLMGALEAADGMLLFGISTAFLFAVIDQVWRMLTMPRDRPR
jgi:hypothetical protein